MSSQGVPPFRMVDALDELCAQGLVRRTFLRLDPERREAVLSAALAEAGEQGPARLSIKSVAERAQVPVGSLYQYFGDRDRLVRFVCEIASRRLRLVLEYAGTWLTQLPLADGFKAYVKDSIAWCRKESSLTKIYIAAAYAAAFAQRQEERSGTEAELAIVKSIAQTVQQLVRSLVEAAAARGELREDVGLEEVCRILNALGIVLIDTALLPGLNSYYRLHDSRHTTNKMIDVAVDLACRGVLRAPGTTSEGGRRCAQQARPGQRAASIRKARRTTGAVKSKGAKKRAGANPAP